jgi:hypothetical protein
MKSNAKDLDRSTPMEGRNDAAKASAEDQDDEETGKGVNFELNAPAQDSI